MEYLIGFVVGVLVAGMIGRAQFNKVQTELRDAKTRFINLLHDYDTERNLNDGLTAELADRTR